MKCQLCGKNEATEELWCNINDKKSNLKLCSECALEFSKKIIPSYGSIYDTIGSLTSGLFGGKASGISRKEPEVLKAVSRCQGCGMSYDEFVATGKLGCSECYKTFHDRMLRPLKQIHGTYEHVGKIPGRTGGQLKTLRKIEKLKAKLSEAIQMQEFEKAAKLRDEINELKGEA